MVNLFYEKKSRKRAEHEVQQQVFIKLILHCDLMPFFSTHCASVSFSFHCISPSAVYYITIEFKTNGLTAFMPKFAKFYTQLLK